MNEVSDPKLPKLQVANLIPRDFQDLRNEPTGSEKLAKQIMLDNIFR